MNKKKGHTLHKAVILLFLLVQFAYVFLIGLPQPVLAVSNFSQANLTLSNSRLSLRAAIASTISNTSWTISGSPTTPASDVDTANLFPQDIICFDNSGTAASNCMNQATYTVNNIPSSTQFGTSTSVTGNVGLGMNVVATQSARMTFTFTPTTGVPSGEFIQIHIPDTAASGYNNDGLPDAVGFDANKLVTGNINAEITPTGFTKSASTLTTTAASATDISMTLSSALVAGTSYSFIVGDAADTTLRFINPAPASGHSRGLADSYSIYIQTCSSVASSVCNGTIYDKTILKVAPVDGVLVSATVEETITYTINAVAGSTSACTTVTTSAASTATTFPFGSVTSFNSSIELAQGHTVTTNAANGYMLTSQSSGLLSLNGLGATTIPNSPGATAASGSACTPAAWTTTSTNGFGYTLTNGNNGHIPSGFTAGQFCPFATVPNLIATLNGVSAATGDNVFVCPRLNVGATQATGAYFTNLTFIATPKF